MIGRPFATLVGREWSRTWVRREGNHLRLGYAAALLIAASIFVIDVATRYRIGVDSLAAMVRSFFYEFSLVQFLAVSFLGTTVFARSLLREKERDTLDLLVISPLRRMEILLGKVAGDFLAVLTILAAGLPVLCFLLNFGGIGFTEVLSIHILLAGQLAIVAGVCVLLTVFLSNYYQVMLLSWLVVFGSIIVPDLGEEFLPIHRGLWIFLSELNVYPLLERELRTVWIRMTPSLYVAAVGLGVLLVCCGVGSIFLDRENALRKERGRHRGLRGRKVIRLLWEAGSSRFLARLFPKVGERRGPLWTRECSLREDALFRGSWVIFVSLYGILVGVAWWYSPPDWLALHAGILAAGGGAAALILFVRTALTPVLAKKDGTFEVLMAAGAEPVEIVDAIIAGRFLRGAYLLAPVAIHAIWFAFVCGARRGVVEVIVLGAIWLVLGAASGVLYSLWLSMKSRTVVSAVLRGVAFGLLFTVIAVFMAALPIFLTVLVAPICATTPLQVYGWTVSKFHRNVMAV